ncbi:MAG TPA: hypothetical protein VHG72_17190 [Polyangia bacterium]|nr:hypothetical protein [Polyangia bacterium]
MPVQLDLHPDDLLDRARRRLISADERLYLDSHLRECATCRFILEAGRAFDAEAAACKAVSLGPLIDRAMHRPHAGGGRAARPPARRLAAGIMTAVATLGGVAFAGYWGHRHPLVEATPVVVATTVAPTPVPRRAAHQAPVIAEPAASPPPARTEPVRPSPPPPRRPPAVRQEVAIAAPAPVETPATLFTAANRARRLGQTEAAERAYQQLWTRFRASPEARASRAIGGRWMLDRGRPSEAIARFSD